jgi:hypothetical protein
MQHSNNHILFSSPILGGAAITSVITTITTTIITG